MRPPGPFRTEKPIIGMVHLAPLPGSPRWRGSLEEVERAALRDANILADEGVDGILVENFGDAPFEPGSVSPFTTAAMAVLVGRLRAALPAPVVLGVNVLRNDARAALAVAAACGARFIRVNVHCGATLTDQGILQGRAHETLRLRAALAPRVSIFADAQVKHGHPLASVSLAEEVADLRERGLADAVLVTGARTGVPPPAEVLAEARRAAGEVPVMAASGVDAANVSRLLAHCDGVIVGTACKRGGRTDAAVDRSRVRRFLASAGARPAHRGNSRARGAPGEGST